MSVEHMLLKTIYQSVQSISMSMNDLTSAVNQLLQQPHLRPHGERVDAVRQQITEELERIQYVIREGHEPSSPEELDLGQKVQDAVTEISQI